MDLARSFNSEKAARLGNLLRIVAYRTRGYQQAQGDG